MVMLSNFVSYRDARLKGPPDCKGGGGGWKGVMTVSEGVSDWKFFNGNESQSFVQFCVLLLFQNLEHFPQVL